MHLLLKKQLAEYKDDMEGLLTAINESYNKYDEDRLLLERSLDLSSQESEEKYRAVVEQSVDIIIIYSGDRIIFANHNFFEQTGYNRSDLQKITVLDLVYAEDKDFVGDVIRRRIRGENAPVSYETRIADKTGKAITVRVRTSKININNKSAYMVTCTDLTDQVKSEQEKIDMQKKMIQADKLASIGMLAAGVAHEINNPLLIAKGFAELIRESLLNDGYTDNVEMMLSRQEHAMDRIANIVNGLRIFARAENEAVTGIDCHKAISDTISLIEFIYKKDSIVIDCKLNAENYMVLGNMGKFLQVIMNLCSNSRDALHEKEIQEKLIKIGTVSENGFFIMKFTDNGIGISKTKLNKIFDPFYTTKNPGKGTGLGLSIVHSVVQELSGTISVNSVEAEGTTFVISVPYLKDCVIDDKQLAEPFHEQLKGSVLVVDDEHDIRAILTNHLSSLGLNVDVAEDGFKALKKINEFAFDYIITDLKMPEMNGVELIKEIKKINTSSKLAVITGSIISDCSPEERDFINNEVSACIVKPFSRKDLYEKLKGL